MTDKLAKDFEEASKGWKLPEKHNDSDEVQLFTVETDDPEALDDFLKLFGGPRGEGEGREFSSFLVMDGDEFAKLDGAYVIYTKLNGPYVYQMVTDHGFGRNIQTLEVENG